MTVEIDDRLTLANAEGIDLDLRLAGIGSRGVALLIDLAVQSATLLLVALVASAFDAWGIAALAIATFLILLGYPILSEAMASGKTLGKAVMRIAVVSTDGTPITFLAAVIRNVVRLVDSLPGTYFVGIATVLVTERSQRVGDLAAGTLVIHTGRPTLPGPSAFEVGAVEAVGSGPVAQAPDGFEHWDVSSVTSEEVAAVRTFLQRRSDLETGHRANLAQTLAFQLMPKVAGVPLEGGPEAFLERVVTVKLNR